MRSLCLVLMLAVACPKAHGMEETSPTTPTNTTTMTVEEHCQHHPTAVFPHPTRCQLYYNCSNHAQPDHQSFFSMYMEECEYPRLFSAVTSQCEHYNDVTCGDREELLDKCEYLHSQCVGHCIPCWLISPSCRGLPDGNNEFRFKEWTPYYAVCRDNRTLTTGYCPHNDILDTAEIFSPDLDACVSRYEAPPNHGGFNCSQQADGLHLDDVTWRPDLYFRCDGGELVAIELCPSAQVFDQQSSNCSSVNSTSSSPSH